MVKNGHGDLSNFNAQKRVSCSTDPKRRDGSGILKEVDVMSINTQSWQ